MGRHLHLQGEHEAAGFDGRDGLRDRQAQLGFRTARLAEHGGLLARALLTIAKRPPGRSAAQTARASRGRSGTP
jgi:hypothetical protein